MSDPRTQDSDPDRAALDELRRAFGVGEPEAAAVSTPEVPARRRDDPPAAHEIDGIDKIDDDEIDDEIDDGIDDGIDDDDSIDDDSIDDTQAAGEPTGVLDPVVTEWEPEVPDDVRLADAPEPTPESIRASAPPRIIRIDDITGAVRPTAASDAPPVPPVIPGADPPTVIAIDADELPDAVYVAGSLEGDGSRSIVFIEDDTAGDAVNAESDRDLRRGIEPRMRERRVQVRRAQSRKRLKWVLAAGVLVLIGIGALALVGSGVFAVREQNVFVTGNVYTDPESLQAVVDDIVGTPTLLVDTEAAERRLEQIPWVDEAKVTVSFPYSATIEIRERQAVATYRGPDGRFRVLDRDGRILDVLDQYPIAYVLVGGPDPVDLEAGQFAPEGYTAAAELAKNLTGSVRGQVERIEVTANGSSLIMWLRDGSDVRFGEARDLFTKLVRLETRLALEPERQPGPIDVSTG
jgi:cell division protein FtsQ